jgi:hypothetical protein
MKAHANSEKLIVWLRLHQTATVAQIAASGMMNSRDASDALQYGLRYGTFERVKRPGARPNERVQYRLTGTPLPLLRTPAAPSFDGLLSAWGIARIPPQLPSCVSVQIALTD